MNFYLAHN